MANDPRIQLITPAGGSFKVESGALTPRAPGDAPPRSGDVVQIKTVVTHPMEPGYRKKADGSMFPRDIIHTFVASYDGQEVFSAALGPGVSTNPYLSFFLKVEGAGKLELKWLGDSGLEIVERISVPVA